MPNTLTILINPQLRMFQKSTLHFSLSYHNRFVLIITGLIITGLIMTWWKNDTKSNELWRTDYLFMLLLLLMKHNLFGPVTIWVGATRSLSLRTDEILHIGLATEANRATWAHQWGVKHSDQSQMALPQVLIAQPHCRV